MKKKRKYTRRHCEKSLGARNLLKWRKKNNLTIDVAALCLSVCDSSISTWELGYVRPQYKTMLKMQHMKITRVESWYQP